MSLLEIFVIIILFWIREIIIKLLEYRSNRLECSELQSNNESISTSTSILTSTSTSIPTSRSTASVPSPTLVINASNQSKKEDNELFKRERDAILIKEREAYLLSGFAKWNAEQNELKRKADIEDSCATLMISSTSTLPSTLPSTLLSTLPSTSPNSSSNNNDNSQPSALLTSASILSTNEKVILIKKELESQLTTKRSFQNKVGAKNKKATVTSLETTPPAETTLKPLQPVDIAQEIMSSLVEASKTILPSIESIPVDITSERSENSEEFGYIMDEATSLFGCLSDDYIMDSLISSFGSLSLSSLNKAPSLIEDIASTESIIENEEGIEMEKASSIENKELTPVEILPSSISINKSNHDSSCEAVKSEVTEEELEERFLRELGWVPPEEDPVSYSEIEEIILKMKSIHNSSNNN